MSHINPDACITCSTCVAQCPIATVTTEFLGPRMIGPAHERFRLMGMAEEQSLHYCSNCKNCDIACPHSVPISTFNMLARAAYAKKHGRSLRDWMLAHGADIAQYVGFIPAALRNFGMNNPLSRQALHALGVHKKAPLPAFATKTFRQQFARIQQPALNEHVVFFPGCYVDIYDPQTGIDMVYALNKAGYAVILPENTSCCGLPMVANGFWEDAHKGAQRNIQALSAWGKKGIPMLTGCPSCALMFNGDIGHYFPELVQEYGKITLMDAQQFLLECFDAGKMRLKESLTDTQDTSSIMYHAPCHLRAQGSGLLGYELLQKAYGNAVQNAHAGCCGISGSYGFKKEKYDISMQVGQNLFTTITASQVNMCSSECGTCRMQITHGTQKPCLHPVSLLKKALQ